jgi:hypothetical protein
MKIVYIAHPIGGDVQGNINKVLAIVRGINLLKRDVVPFAPYIVDCLSLDDSILDQRIRGILNNTTLFNAGFINEVWLFGDKISKGMAAEIALANKLGIKVVSMSEGTSV